MLIIFQTQCHQLIPFFQYSLILLLNHHHLSTDNIKFISQQIIIASLMRGLDSGIELATTQYPNILQFKNGLMTSKILLYGAVAV